MKACDRCRGRVALPSALVAIPLATAAAFIALVVAVDPRDPMGFGTTVGIPMAVAGWILLAVIGRRSRLVRRRG